MSAEKCVTFTYEAGKYKVRGWNCSVGSGERHDWGVSWLPRLVPEGSDPGMEPGLPSGTTEWN